MSDPTIQTFCCHHSNTSNITAMILKDFSTEAYNFICLFSSTLGILGAFYQILPREQYSKSHRWMSFSATRGRKIIVWLAASDLFAALGVFIRSLIWIKYENIMPAIDDDSSVIYCIVFSAWTQYFYTSTWIWTLCYAIDMKLVLSERNSKLLWYHLAAWVLPAILTVTGLCLLYFPDANCHSNMSSEETASRILPNYLATYIPMVTVMIANPFLYHCSTKKMLNIITYASGQLTKRERELMEAIRIKFSIINAVFYICWLPNLINSVAVWMPWLMLPYSLVTNMWYVMAFTNPLQALLNTLVYRRWNSGTEKIVMPCLRYFHWRETREHTTTTLSSQQHHSFEENLPLLRSLRRSSINGFSQYK